MESMKRPKKKKKIERKKEIGRVQLDTAYHSTHTCTNEVHMYAVCIQSRISLYLALSTHPLIHRKQINNNPTRKMAKGFIHSLKC